MATRSRISIAKIETVRWWGGGGCLDGITVLTWTVACCFDVSENLKTIVVADVIVNVIVTVIVTVVPTTTTITTNRS